LARGVALSGPVSSACGSGADDWACTAPLTDRIDKANRPALRVIRRRMPTIFQTPRREAYVYEHETLESGPLARPHQPAVDVVAVAAKNTAAHSPRAHRAGAALIVTQHQRPSETFTIGPFGARRSTDLRVASGLPTNVVVTVGALPMRHGGATLQEFDKRRQAEPQTGAAPMQFRQAG
jgi:hypothetical protein